MAQKLLTAKERAKDVLDFLKVRTYAAGDISSSAIRSRAHWRASSIADRKFQNTRFTQGFWICTLRLYYARPYLNLISPGSLPRAVTISGRPHCSRRTKCESVKV